MSQEKCVAIYDSELNLVAVCVVNDDSTVIRAGTDL